MTSVNRVQVRIGRAEELEKAGSVTPSPAMTGLALIYHLWTCGHQQLTHRELHFQHSC